MEFIQSPLMPFDSDEYFAKHLNIQSLRARDKFDIFKRLPFLSLEELQKLHEDLDVLKLELERLMLEKS